MEGWWIGQALVISAIIWISIIWALAAALAETRAEGLRVLDLAIAHFEPDEFDGPVTTPKCQYAQRELRSFRERMFPEEAAARDFHVAELFDRVSEAGND